MNNNCKLHYYKYIMKKTPFLKSTLTAILLNCVLPSVSPALESKKPEVDLWQYEVKLNTPCWWFERDDWMTPITWYQNIIQNWIEKNLKWHKSWFITLKINLLLALTWDSPMSYEYFLPKIKNHSQEAENMINAFQKKLREAQLPLSIRNSHVINKWNDAHCLFITTQVIENWIAKTN